MPKKVIGRFSVSYLQILDENGNVDKKLEPDIPKVDLQKIYRAMALAREFDGKMLKLQRQGRIGTFPPCTGQEAAHIVPTYQLTEKDWFLGAFRETGSRLLRGETMEQILLYYNGYEEGSIRPANSFILPISIIISSHMLHAVGIGYAMKYKGIKDAAVMAFFGDGATSQGDFHEALNFASAWNVPVVFICQNNHWAISVPRSKQTVTKTLAQKAIAYDIPTIQVDGNDPPAMWVATEEALKRARSGGGPSFIEADTYRMLMHTTADDPTKYREDKEIEIWQKRDPIDRMKKYIIQKGYWDEKRQAELDKDIKTKVDQAVKRFEEMKDFKPDAPFDHIYETKHASLEEQREMFLEELRKEAADA